MIAPPFGRAAVCIGLIVVGLAVAGVAMAEPDDDAPVADDVPADRDDSLAFPHDTAAPGAEHGAADVQAGGEMFRRQCSACHTIDAGQHKTGPSLAGIVGRKAGSTDFPRYRGFVGADFDWTQDRLNTYLADPLAFIVANTNNHATSMTFRVPSAKQRHAIIAYLTSLQ